MRHVTYWVLGVLVLGLATLLPADAAETKANPVAEPAQKVDDKGGFFSLNAVEEANKKIAKLKQEHHKDLVFETLEKVDPKLTIDQIAEKQFNRERVNGVYILISKYPHKLRIQVGKITAEKAFPEKDKEELDQILKKKLAEGDKTLNYDSALLASVDFVCKAMAKNDPHPAGATAQTKPNSGGGGGHHQTDPKPARPAPQEINWVLWIAVGIVALLVLWLIMGIIRAATAPRGYGGPGMAGGGGGGYGGGGGGGGFFSSLLGGMFGAAAGMWMYSHFFGGSANAGSNFGGGNTGTGGDYGQGADQSDVGAGSTGTTSDWGDDKGDGKDAGGGDTGGGDWGSGGDKGGGDSGGGDWGSGGGGDAGGGDWGGGGDAGGGGGDWGGGGGGGDWGGGGGGGDW